jgi:hypothetical protein
VGRLARLVLGRAAPKRVGTQIVTGPMLAGLAEAYVKAINEGAVPTISTAWQVGRCCWWEAIGIRQGCHSGQSSGPNRCLRGATAPEQMYRCCTHVCRRCTDAQTYRRTDAPHGAPQVVAEQECRRASQRAEDTYMHAFNDNVAADELALKREHEAALAAAKRVYKDLAVGDKLTRANYKEEMMKTCDTRWGGGAAGVAGAAGVGFGGGKGWVGEGNGCVQRGDAKTCNSRWAAGRLRSPMLQV